MKKNSIVYSDEIDLTHFFKIIFKKKIQIILIMLVIFLALYSYKQYNIKPESFEISLNITQSKKNISENFSFINEVLFNIDSKVLREDLKDQLTDINKISVLKRLMKDLQYNQELIAVLKKNDTVKEKLARLPKEVQQKYLYEYIKLFSVEKIELDNYELDYIVKFIWADVDEGKKILDDILKLGVVNLQSTIFNEIENRLLMERKKTISQDQEKINFLTEQKKIAEELNIIGDQVDIIKNYNNNIADYSSGGAYYLRGYKAINMEINFLKNRVYKDLSYIREEMDTLKKNSDFDWIHYNIFLAETRLLNNNIGPNWKVSVLMSIVVGLFYAFIAYFIQSQKVIRNKRAN
jgi:hypothetical protein